MKKVAGRRPARQAQSSSLCKRFAAIGARLEKYKTTGWLTPELSGGVTGKTRNFQRPLGRQDNVIFARGSRRPLQRLVSQPFLFARYSSAGKVTTDYRNISPAIIPATIMTKPSSATTRKRAMHPPKINKQGRLTGGKTTSRVAAGP